jgi:hypothetical protein
VSIKNEDDPVFKYKYDPNAIIQDSVLIKRPASPSKIK